MTRLLFKNSSSLVILPSLATIIGLNESVILQQMHYWLERSTNERDSYKWVYNTYEDWAQQFPFWSISTIRRTIKKLEDLGLIISGNYNKMKLDNTKWYRINYQMIEDLEKSAVQLEQMESLTISSNHSEQTSNIISSYAQSEQAESSTSPLNKLRLNTPLPESTSKSTSKSTSEILNDEENPLVKIQPTPHSFYQENGFGYIGGYMSKKIAYWCNDLSDELVIEAMKYAIEHGSKTWAYVEAILRDWVKKQYTTVSDVYKARQQYKEQRVKTHQRPAKHRKSTKPATEQAQIPTAEDLVRIGLSLGRPVETIIVDVQQFHEALTKEYITSLLAKQIELTNESEKRNRERAERFEALARKKRGELILTN